MSAQLGGVLFVVSTGALALWLVVRRPWRPSSMTKVVIHAICALLALQVAFLLVRAGSPAWWRFAGLLLVVTPALVYTWLSGAWAALFVRDARQGSRP
ncbi:MAG TPA: hypothetical protein VFR32_05925 [Gaiellaceae bacterium]|nr:hypothetical protein [Gaiellaceae bacterium]